MKNLRACDNFPKLSQALATARCVFIRTNFSSCTRKDDLAFFQKGEKLRNLFFQRCHNIVN